MKKILILNNKEKPCGIQQYGERIINPLKNSKQFFYFYREIETEEQAINEILYINPSIVLYNYSPGTMPFITKVLPNKFKDVKHTALIHEGYSYLNNFIEFTNIIYLQDAVEIAPEFQSSVFSTPVRYLLSYTGEYQENIVPKIGSFGFGFPRKNFDFIVEKVNNEFDVANIEFYISNSFHSDPNGDLANKTIEDCYKKITKPDVKLFINRNFVSDDELLTFLSSNDINCFFYGAEKTDGIAGSTDLALSVKRPIAVTKVPMFSHLHSLVPEICIENSSIKEIIKRGIGPLQPIYNAFSEDNFIKVFDDICERILNNA